MNTKTKTREEQISVVEDAISKLEGTLMGDWLTESIGPAEAAIESDYLPSLWVEGINGWVQSKVTASLSEREADFDKREADLAKREADFERTEKNFENWRKEFRETVRETHSKLEYCLDHL
tara:strand:+ start:111 stop:473 length:363 start_codon:yes stop_codon:yes gene_type:complete